jgi:cytochrome c553
MSTVAPPLFIALGRAVDEARARLEEGLDEATAWIERVRGGVLAPMQCAICERKDGPFEEHHVAGRLNSDLTLTACLRCHSRLSERQNGWDPRWQRAGSLPALSESFLLRGLSDLCEERARHFGPAYHELGKRLRAIYAKRARETVP